MNINLSGPSHSNATGNDSSIQLLNVKRSVLITFFVIRGCICLLGTLSNLLFILSFFTEKKLRTASNCLIGHLAFVDLLICCFVLPLGLSIRTGRGSFGSCQLEKRLVALLPHLSVQTQCLISCNRYFLVTKSRFVYNQCFTKIRIALYLAVGWTFAVACVVVVDVLAQTPGDKTTENCDATSPLTVKLDNYILWLLSFIYFSVTLGFYGMLIRFLRRNALMKRAAKASVTLFFLLLVFATCFILAPFAVYVLSQFKEDSRNSITYYLRECFEYVVQLGISLIIILYGYRLKHFNNAVKKLFRPCWASEIQTTSEH